MTVPLKPFVFLLGGPFVLLNFSAKMYNFCVQSKISHTRIFSTDTVFGVCDTYVVVQMKGQMVKCNVCQMTVRSDRKIKNSEGV